MLLNLDLKQFVLIEHIQLEFCAGLTTLTGETGAGKSILLDALGFILGGKADIHWIRHGQNKTDISATFIPSNTAYAWLLDNDFIEDTATSDTTPREILIRRTLDITGRSRCTINGSVATLTQLRELGEYLIDIHGQGEHQSLIKPHNQRLLLDEYAHNQADRKAVKTAWDSLQAALKALQVAEAQHAQIDAKREQLAWVFEELSAIQPTKGEWEQLEIDHKRLSNSATLLTHLQNALTVLDDAEDSLLQRTRTLNTTVNHLSKYDAQLEILAEPLELAYIQLQEASHNIANYLNKIDLDSEQLATVEQRMASLHSVARKLRLPPAELAERFNSVKNELDRLNTEQNFSALHADIAIAQKKYTHAAHQLSKTRFSAAKQLSAEITQVMQSLALSGGQFAVVCSSSTASAQGIDSVEFQVSANIGQPIRPLAKVASGGELARISLALCVVTSQQTVVPTLIFDEVDTGIGGATADIVGQQLRAIGNAVQVLAVTHLPQVAANAHQQLKVSKSLINDITVSNVIALSDEERCQEIARMLGGEQITATTLQHAQELLTIAATRTTH
jgi:DNA repair protein RecN (Recombination protein N)